MLHLDAFCPKNQLPVRNAMLRNRPLTSIANSRSGWVLNGMWFIFLMSTGLADHLKKVSDDLTARAVFESCFKCKSEFITFKTTLMSGMKIVGTMIRFNVSWLQQVEPAMNERVQNRMIVEWFHLWLHIIKCRSNWDACRAQWMWALRSSSCRNCNVLISARRLTMVWSFMLQWLHHLDQCPAVNWTVQASTISK